MRKLENVKTETYRMDCSFTIDIVETEEVYEAYIQRNGYGVKNLMFGVLKSEISYDAFLKMVESCV